MYTFENQIRVRYAETDRMNFVYYGNYASYFEVARVEALRNLGVSYKKMEEEGVMLPVLEYSVKYLRPAFYDDVLTIKTIIPVLPSVKIVFNYEIYNADGQKLNEATTTLVFISKETGKPCKGPTSLLDKLSAYF